MTIPDKGALDVADATLEYIKTHPDDWVQRDWRQCFAGHFAKLDPTCTTELVPYEDEEPCGCCTSEDRTELIVADKDGTKHSVMSWFTVRLGSAADPMVWALNEVGDLEAGVAALREGRDVRQAIEQAWTTRQKGQVPA